MTPLPADAVKTQEDARALIGDAYRQQRELEHGVQLLARTLIPDFHFMDYKVSNFWECERSPIGWCVFELDEGRFHIDCVCRYCGDPVERK